MKEMYKKLADLSQKEVISEVISKYHNCTVGFLRNISFTVRILKLKPYSKVIGEIIATFTKSYLY